MSQATILLTPLHYLYLIGVIVILAVMVLRKDTPAVCIAFLFLLGLTGLGTVTGGIQVVFKAILYAAKEFMEIIATIALVTALSKCLMDLGSDSLLMTPMKKIMKTPSVTWWILGLTMMVFSFFLWPSPSVALVGAIMLPFAVRAGLNPLSAAVAMNLFGHGIALSCDFIIQGAPAVSAAAAAVPTSRILNEGRPVFLVMGAVTVIAAYLLNKKDFQVKSAAVPDSFLRGSSEGESPDTGSLSDDSPAAGSLSADSPAAGPLSTDSPAAGSLSDDFPAAGSLSGSRSQRPENSGKEENRPFFRRASVLMAILTPAAFLADILLMAFLHLNGGDATSVVSGTAVLLMCVGAILGFGKSSLEKVTDYVTDGFLFAIRIFAPVIIIGAFFFLGGSGINSIMGLEMDGGIMNDWAVWLAAHAPLNKYMAALIEMIVGGLTGLDGSGFSGLPLTGALAHTFGAATGASVPILASLGQITAIFVGGGTIVPWGLIPVAAICNVSPLDLASKNLLPVFIGFLAALLLACALI